MNRKNFLKSFAFAAVSGSVLLAACGGGDNNKTQNNATTAPEEPKAEEPQATAQADCNDLSGVAEADLKQRESLGYVAQSTEEGKNCINCRFYQPGSQPNGCGGCQLFKGPVAEQGYCKSWFKKEG
ncbi:MAG: high-potential iron-sulfur protein [Bacteroidia bacterium]